MALLVMVRATELDPPLKKSPQLDSLQAITRLSRGMMLPETRYRLWYLVLRVSTREGAGRDLGWVCHRSFAMDISCCNASRAFHTRSCRRGKSGQVVLTTMHKLLLILNAVIRDQVRQHREAVPAAINA